MNSKQKNFKYKTLLKFFIYFFKFNGSISVNLDVDSQSWGFTCSKNITTIIVCVVSLLHFTWFVTGLIYILLNDHDYKNLRLFEKILYIATKIFFIILAPLLRAIFTFRRQKTTEIYNKLVRIKDIANVLSNSSEKIVKKSAFQAMKIFSIALILWISQVSTSIFQQNIETFFLHTLPFLLCYLTIHSPVLEYIFLLLFIKEKFKVINELNYELPTSNKIFRTSIDIYKLQTACKLHSELYELSLNISQFFSLPIFLCIFQMFSALLIYSYIIVKPLVFVERVDYYVYLSCLFRIAQITFLLLTLNMYATSVIAEVVRKFLN